jgi:hypothetical protein
VSLPVARLAWTAAVIDLRGKLIKKKNQQRATPQLVLAVESKVFAVIRQLASLTGTNPEFASGREAPDWMRKGCIEHCPEQHVHYAHSLPPKGRWTITGAGMVVVLYNVMPYLVSTDQPWHEIMEEGINQAVLIGQGSGMTRKSLMRLHELGWEMPSTFEKALEGWRTTDE